MRLDINYKIRTVINRNTWRLNNTFLNNKQVTEIIKREIKKLLEKNDNENKTTQYLWDTAKAILRGKFLAIQSYFKRQPSLTFRNFVFLRYTFSAVYSVMYISPSMIIMAFQRL